MRFSLAAKLILTSSMFVTTLLIIYSIKHSVNNTTPTPSSTITEASTTHSLPPQPIADIKIEQQSNYNNKVKPANRKGYLLNLKSTNHMISSMQDLLTKSCSFKHMSRNINIAEPLIDGNSFGFMKLLNKSKGFKIRKKTPSLFDIYDQDALDKLARKDDLTPIKSFETFLEEAPREIILVINNLQRLSSEIYLQDLIDKTFSPHGFYIKRVARFIPSVMGAISMEEFKNRIYESDQPEDVTVMFDELGSMKGYDTIDPTCAKYQFISDPEYLKPSPLISQYTQQYTEMNLEKRYISIMFRTQHILDSVNGEKQKEDRIKEYIDTTIKKLNQLKAEYNIQSVFVAMDIGQHGSTDKSNLSKSDSANRIKQHIKNLIPTVYDDKITFHEWEQGFNDITSSASPNLTAMMQKDIASKGECLILVGGGAFQTHALELYHARTESDRCVIRLGSDPTVL